MRRTMMALAGLVGAAAVAMPVWARPHGRPHGPPPCGDGAMRAVMAMLHGGDLSDGNSVSFVLYPSSFVPDSSSFSISASFARCMAASP